MDTNGHGRRDVDELIIAALAAGASYEEAGKAARVSKSTVRRRMTDPNFRAEVSQARHDLVETLRARLIRAAPSAIERLERLSADAESESVRLSAARDRVRGVPPSPRARATRARTRG